MKITNLHDQKQVHHSQDEFAFDILAGLSSNPKEIYPKYFYDDVGSELFQKITESHDYYPTKAEFSILEKISDKVPDIVDAKREIDIIELGAGDGHKSKLITDGFLDKKFKVNYYPIDISEKAMELLNKNITETSQLSVNGIVGDYFSGLSHVRSISKNRQLVLFLGSNIGNFNQKGALQFLRRLWKSLNADDLALIGFDLKKDIPTLNRAYNDSEGFTAQFNLNVLARINRELGGHFSLNKFQHCGFYNPRRGAMESYLISLEAHSVPVQALQRTFAFEKYEPIHLEYSFKFLPSDIAFLAHQTGFKVEENFTDSREYFMDSLWKVTKD